METSIHYENFLAFYSAHFSIYIDPLKNFFKLILGRIFWKKIFLEKWADLYTNMSRVKF